VGRTRRRERKEELPPVEEIEASPEEVELSDFLDGLGPHGISEVSLYRILPSGKQRFITSGPPTQFSEQYVQAQFGDGDYLARAKLNGRWYKSKSFSVEALPGTAVPKMAAGHDSEIERLKMELEAQRLRLEQQQAQMEADRREREQRNHEIFLKVLETRGAPSGPTLSDIVSTVKDLRDLSGNGNSSSFDHVKEALALADQINALRGDVKDDDGILSWLKPLAPELVRALVMNRNGANGPASPVPSAPLLPLEANALPVNSTHAAQAQSPVTPGPDAAVSQAKKQVLAYLLNMARLSRSPELYAEMSIEQVDIQADQIAATLIQELVGAPDFQTWFASLEKLDATVITQRAWFEEYFQAMRAAVAGRSQPEAEGFENHN